MSPEQALKDFNLSIDAWQNSLCTYSFDELCTRLGDGQWSMGQMYRHLIEDTTFFAEQMLACMQGDEFATESATAHGKKMLDRDEFPDVIIQGAPANAFIPQPRSKDELTADLEILKKKVNEVAAMIPSAPFKGKAQHPGLGYFDAEEWLQFAGMHFRHHLRQKQRIDSFLKQNRV